MRSVWSPTIFKWGEFVSYARPAQRAGVISKLVAELAAEGNEAPDYVDYFHTPGP
jgi:hypothetical protein